MRKPARIDESTSEEGIWSDAIAPLSLLPPLLPLPELVLVGVTEATEPMVGDGTGTLPLFIESDSLESCAKPTDGGLARYTEYTFFCQKGVSKTSKNEPPRA